MININSQMTYHEYNEMIYEQVLSPPLLSFENLNLISGFGTLMTKSGTIAFYKNNQTLKNYISYQPLRSIHNTWQ